MNTLLGDPDMELRIYGENYADHYHYDPFIGRWIKKRKERRQEQGKKPLFPFGNRKQKTGPKPAPAHIRYATDPTKESAPPTPPDNALIKPLTKQEARAHRNANKAIQEELKTKQEELKTLGMEKQVAQEDLVAKDLEAKTSMMSTGHILLSTGGVVIGIAILKVVFTAPKPA